MKNIIWDLDGTLADSYEQILNVLESIFSQYDIFDRNQVYVFIKTHSVVDYFKTQADRYDLDLDDLYKQYNQVTSDFLASDYKLIEGADDTLKALSMHKHYIYTHRGNSTFEILQTNGIHGIFVEVITSEHKFERKPAPDALLYLINKYKMSLEDTYYIGDRSLDVLCGINAGIQTIYFGDDENHQATYNVKDLRDITNIMN